MGNCIDKSEYMRNWWSKNPQYRKEYKNKNAERIKNADAIYRENNKDKIQKWIQENKERIREYKREYYLKNKDINRAHRIQYGRTYRKNNPDKTKEYRQSIKEKANSYRRDKRRDDLVFKSKCAIRSLISNSFRRRGYKKTSKTYKILGIEYPDFIKYFECKFSKGMNWGNYGKWEIDHIIPLSTAQTESDVYALCHYTNLQPLWKKDNLDKRMIDSGKIY